MSSYQRMVEAAKTARKEHLVYRERAWGHFLQFSKG